MWRNCKVLLKFEKKTFDKRLQKFFSFWPNKWHLLTKSLTYIVWKTPVICKSRVWSSMNYIVWFGHNLPLRLEPLTYNKVCQIRTTVLLVYPSHTYLQYLQCKEMNWFINFDGFRQTLLSCWFIFSNTPIDWDAQSKLQSSHPFGSVKFRNKVNFSTEVK